MEHVDARTGISEASVDQLASVDRVTRTVTCADLPIHLRIGHGASLGHYGELFQGQIEDRHGTRHRCLVGLPCNRFQASVVFRPDTSGTLHIEPANKRKALRALKLALDFLGVRGLGGTATVASNIREAKGYGSSTADCVAAARAAADAVGRVIPAVAIARLVVQAEKASDNVMFERAVLFAQREGVVLEEYGRRFPNLEVFGVDTDPQGVVDTLRHPPAAYSWQEVRMFQMMAAALRRAIGRGDLDLLGRIASASALINERFLPKRLFEDLRRYTHEVGALGLAAAHSGTVVAIVFDPDDARLEQKIERLQRAVVRLGIHEEDIMRFQTGWRGRGR